MDTSLAHHNHIISWPIRPNHNRRDKHANVLDLLNGKMLVLWLIATALHGLDVLNGEYAHTNIHC